jgi:hypothetical protein
MMRIGGVLLSLFVFGTPLPARNRIAYIEFFGYAGIDVSAVQEALPFHSGDNLSNDLENQARTAVKKVTGRDATDFERSAALTVVIPWYSLGCQALPAVLSDSTPR